MRRCLLLVVFFLSYSVCFAHTIVLNNGEKLQGDEIFEQDGTLWIMQKSDKEKTGYDYSKGDVYPLIDIESIDGIQLDKAESNFKLANFYFYKEHDPVKAAEFYENAVKLAPKLQPAIVNLMFCYNNSGIPRIEDSIRLGEKAVNDFPGNDQIHFNLGVAYALSGREEEAISQYNRTLEIRPDSYEAYANLGMLYYSSGKHKEARENLTKAKELLTGKDQKQLLDKINALLQEIQ